ncbi:MAG: site-specific integrase, partial [Desulfobacterales bacterium]|nr:site-specific integrase [Desulfobacterales bacterium]
NIEIRHLKAIFNTAVKLGYLKSSPFNKIKHLKVPESDFPKFFEVEDINRIRDAFKNDSFKHLIEFYILTGARLREPLSLTWDDVDLRREQVTIRGKNTKAKRNRIISFQDDAKLRKLIYSLPQREDGLLFGPPDNNKQWNPRWIQEKTKMVLDGLGYTWATIKTFRHTYISHLVMAGVPLVTVQELVGHQTYITTLNYSHLAPEHKTKMIKKRPY